MTGSPAVSRTLTVLAIGFLTFDGAALAGIGLMSGRLVLLLIGVAFFLSAGLVLLYWRWHLRRLEEIAAERRALAKDAREMRSRR